MFVWVDTRRAPVSHLFSLGRSFVFWHFWHSRKTLWQIFCAALTLSVANLPELKHITSLVKTYTVTRSLWHRQWSLSKPLQKIRFKFANVLVWCRNLITATKLAKLCQPFKTTEHGIHCWFSPTSVVKCLYFLRSSFLCSSTCSQRRRQGRSGHLKQSL